MAENPDLKRIGRYDIERVLGEGAMGVVYEGKDTRLHRRVAIKTILKSALDSDSAREYSTRFKREAQAVARLNHPNIVQVFDFAEEGDVAYIVMEFVKGRELKTFFDAKERFDLKEAVHIMGELCEALHFAHEAGIIHRDIKPANVMIDSQGRVKLTDFGVARITDLERTMSERTQAGAVIGTPAYMSPEQIQAGTIDRRTDIFSAGVILYEFLTGGKPFTGSGTWTIAKKIISEEPPLPSSVNSALSPLFDGVIARALSKKVDTRYQTARELGYALQRSFEGLPATDDVEKTVILSQAAARQAMPAPQEAAGNSTVLSTVPAAVPESSAPHTKATELEFWRSIKDGDDPADFDLYVQQFPSGIYTALAKRKSARLRGVAPEAAEQERREIEEAARREAEARKKLAEEKAELEASLARREAEFLQREAEAQAKLAQEQARHQAELAQREAEFRQREAAGPKKMSLLPVFIVLAVAAIGAGVWQAVKPPDPMAQRVAELTQLLEKSRQREAELAQSKQREAELANELDQMRQREAEAKKSGDVAKQRELAEQLKQREAEAARQAELTRQREIEAKKQAESAEQGKAELAKLQAGSGKKASAAKGAEPAKAVEPVKVAIATPAPPPTPVPDTAPVTLETMLQRAISLEHDGKTAEAARLYRQVTREGKGDAAGQAAKRYGDLLQKGAPGVPRDYGEALRYYEIARLNGVDVPVAKAR
ncbi:MAG TPA: protein kinase [Burkholderiales bacterium]|nr:protein kinase [Burkholderiales bacterium]